MFIIYSPWRFITTRNPSKWKDIWKKNANKGSWGSAHSECGDCWVPTLMSENLKTGYRRNRWAYVDDMCSEEDIGWKSWPNITWEVRCSLAHLSFVSGEECGKCQNQREYSVGNRSWEAYGKWHKHSCAQWSTGWVWHGPSLRREQEAKCTTAAFPKLFSS
jgi:hypothetical protein